MAKGRKTGGRNFPKGKSGNPAGRQKIPTEVKLIRKLTADAFIDLVEVLAYANQAAIDMLIKDDQAPHINRIVAQALENARKHGNFFLLNQILDRVIGKPKDQVVLSGKLETESRNDQALLEEIRKKLYDPRNERKA